jgi:hypothetical protein
VVPEWVFACQEAAAGLGSESGPLPPERDYAVKHAAFEGMCITSSGYGGPGREHLRREVELGQGIFTKTLDVNTTHLIVEAPVGDKYHASLMQHKVIVTQKWCFDSGVRGKAQPVEKYTVTGPGYRATSSRGGGGSSSSSSKDDTRQPDQQFGEVVEAGAKEKAKQHSRDAINVDIDTETVAGQYLDCCIVHIFSDGQHRFSPQIRKTLVQLVRRGGGTRLDNFDESVTHIVAPPSVSRYARVVVAAVASR